MQEPLVDLDAREVAAWRGLLRSHAALVRELDRELELAHGLPLNEYEVLFLLSRAPDGRLRMSDLADQVLLSQSGLTRLADRLERAGLVVRVRCAEDRRGLFAEITDEGRSRFALARQTHLEGVQRLFLSRLQPAQLDALALAWEAVLDEAP
jgi:DNA-binding MarR family transcriptional regulator